MSRDTTIVTSFDHAGYTIEIHRDDDPTSPFDWDNVGHIWIMPWSDYAGDPEAGETYSRELNFSLREYRRDFPALKAAMLKETPGAIILPIEENYDGSFIVANSEAWYTGVAYVTREQAIKELAIVDRPAVYVDGQCVKQARFHQVSRMTKKLRDVAVSALQGLLQTYSDYNTGNVYGYVILDSNGETIDSCWGMYPNHDPREDDEQYAITEAKAAAEAHYREMLARHDEINRRFCEQNRELRELHAVILDQTKDFWLAVA